MTKSGPNSAELGSRLRPMSDNIGPGIDQIWADFGILLGRHRPNLRRIGRARQTLGANLDRAWAERDPSSTKVTMTAWETLAEQRKPCVVEAESAWTFAHSGAASKASPCQASSLNDATLAGHQCGRDASSSFLGFSDFVLFRSQARASPQFRGDSHTPAGQTLPKFAEFGP